MINNLVFEILKLRIEQESQKEKVLDFSFVKEFDENSLWIILDCSGFDLELIKESLTDLMAINHKWKPVKNGKMLSGMISSPSIRDKDNLCLFSMLKNDLQLIIQTNL